MYKVYVKITLIILLFLSIFSMPYWYFQILRLLGTIGFFYLAYTEHLSKNSTFAFIFFILAILFNPIFKFYFGRTGWLIVDFIGIAIIIASYFISKKIKAL